VTYLIELPHLSLPFTIVPFYIPYDKSSFLTLIKLPFFLEDSNYLTNEIILAESRYDLTSSILTETCNLLDILLMAFAFGLKTKLLLKNVKKKYQK
jgi:hypothetical protein